MSSNGMRLWRIAFSPYALSLPARRAFCVGGLNAGVDALPQRRYRALSPRHARACAVPPESKTAGSPAIDEVLKRASNGTAPSNGVAESNVVANFVSTQIDGIAPPEQAKEEGKVDPFRDTLLRYMGYANEVGESFRPFIGVPGVIVSYFVASGYVIADSAYQARKAYRAETTKGALRNAKVASAAFDSLLWQSLASVACPGFTINRVVALCEYLVHVAQIPEGLAHDWIPTLIGLATIPLIVKPIDYAVHVALDKTTRPISRRILAGFEARAKKAS